MKNDIYTRSRFAYVTSLCPNDTIQYQACGGGTTSILGGGDRYPLFQITPICGKLCFHEDMMYKFHPTSQICPGAETRVKHTISTVEGESVEIWIKKGGWCDGVCDEVELEGGWKTGLLSCVEESYCDGYKYGAVNILSSRSKRRRDYEHSTGSLMPHSSENAFPLYNGSRCFMPLTSTAHKLIHGLTSVAYCNDSLDQTNCTDPAKIAGSCHIGGHLSTVSIYVLCHEINGKLCDDDMQEKCTNVNRHCTIHKHRLCNGQDDCAMGADERMELCLKLTQRWCVRGFSQNQGLLRIPVDWVQDGVTDCLNGEDEKSDWQTCGKGDWRTIKYSANICTNVFICKENRSQFLDSSHLCSFAGNCGEGVCHMAKRLGSITIVQKSRERFHNNLFVCKNTNCILFEKVCDLADDCGDRSDEEECTNNFQCSDKSGFLALSQKCDGRIDCKDLSDECNDSCKRKAVSSNAILGISLAMGIAGFLFGIGSLYKSFNQKSEKSGEYINQMMVLGISCGDLLTSTYLLTITTSHWFHGSKFCEQQIAWISGIPCTVIGVLNSTGSTISSLAMALISCFRLRGTVRALRYRRSDEVTRELKFKLGYLLWAVTVVSLTVSVFPLLEPFDDWFVNGLVFEKEIGLFLGVMDKSRLLKILRGYHGSHETRHGVSGNDISWRTFQQMISEMFSQDYDPVRGIRPSG
eukprot:sb/3462637/